MPAYEIGTPGDPYLVERKAADRYLTLWEDRVANAIALVYDRAAKRTLSKLRSAKARRGTYLWDGEGAGVKAPDADGIYNAGQVADELEEAVRPLIVALSEEAGNALATSLGTVLDFGDPAIAASIGLRVNRIRDTSDTTFEAVKRQLQTGARNGEAIDRLAKRVQNTMAVASGSRARTIARTEVAGAVNEVHMTTARQSGGIVENKVWLAASDDRVRKWHEDGDGQTRQLDDKFDIGGEQLDAPLDPAGSAANTIQCRCTLLFERAAAVGGETALSRQGQLPAWVQGVQKEAIAAGLLDPLKGPWVRKDGQLTVRATARLAARRSAGRRVRRQATARYRKAAKGVEDALAKVVATENGIRDRFLREVSADEAARLAGMQADAMKARHAMQAKRTELWRAALIETLSEAGPLGLPAGRDVLNTGVTSRLAVEAVDQAVGYLPRHWALRLVDEVTPEIRRSGRGREFPDGTVWLISQHTPGVHRYTRSATHELVHRYERLADDGLAFEVWAHKRSRTAGDPTRRLIDLEPASSYTPDELTRENKFFDPYVGKVYGDDPTEPHEVLAMGIEHLFHDPPGTVDPATADFVLGIMSTWRG